MPLAKVFTVLLFGLLLLAACEVPEDEAEHDEDEQAEAEPEEDDEGEAEAPNGLQEDGSFERIDIVVPVGEPLPTPEELGIGDDVEPVEIDGDLDVSVADFGVLWNEAAESYEGVEIEEWEVGYAKGTGAISYEWAEWLKASGSWAFEDEVLDLFVVEVSTEGGNVDGALVDAALDTMLIALAGQEGAAEVAADLGLDAITVDDFEDGYDAEVERDGIRYELYVGSFGIDLEAWPA